MLSASYDRKRPGDLFDAPLWRGSELAERAHDVRREDLTCPALDLFHSPPRREGRPVGTRHLQRLERVGDGENLHGERAAHEIDRPVGADVLVVVAVFTHQVERGTHRRRDWQLPDVAWELLE